MDFSTSTPLTKFAILVAAASAKVASLANMVTASACPKLIACPMVAELVPIPSRPVFFSIKKPIFKFNSLYPANKAIFISSSESTAISPPFSTNAIFAERYSGSEPNFILFNIISANAPATAAIGPTSHKTEASLIKLISSNSVVIFIGEKDVRNLLFFFRYFSKILRLSIRLIFASLIAIFDSEIIVTSDSCSKKWCLYIFIIMINYLLLS